MTSWDFPIHLGTHDPREDIIDTCLKTDSGDSDISFTDENGDSVKVNIEYEDYGGKLDNVTLPALLVREVRGSEIVTSIGWNTYERRLEFDISFYMVGSDEVDVRDAKRKVQDEIVWHVQNNQDDVTYADRVQVTSVRPQTDFDVKRNVYGFTITLEVVQKD